MSQAAASRIDALPSQDKRFIFKSLPPHEVLTLRTTLAAYYRHLTE